MRLKRRKSEVFSSEERATAEHEITTRPAPTSEELQRIRKITRARTTYGALLQIMRAAPQPDLQDEIIAHYATFFDNDGVEFSLVRLLVATTNAAMDCFARANTDEAKIRDLEFSSAVKLALVAAALGKALDHHQPFRQAFVDETPSPSNAQTRAPDKTSDPGSHRKRTTPNKPRS
jgi:hypothetical protein